jgi:biopolymer transport protein ExbD
MPSVKIKKHAPQNDMTPFVDVAFLILSFFMLATKFKPEDPVEITTPSSVSSAAAPEKDVFTVQIDKAGKAYISLDNPEFSKKMIENVNTGRNLGLTESEMRTFVNSPSIGVPFNQLKSYLQLDPESQKKFAAPGIPVEDSTGGEMFFWVRDVLSAYSGRKLNLVVKADNSTKYPAFKNVLNAFKKNDQNKFLLITNPEDAPAGTALYETRQKQVNAKKQ